MSVLATTISILGVKPAAFAVVLASLKLLLTLHTVLVNIYK